MRKYIQILNVFFDEYELGRHKANGIRPDGCKSVAWHYKNGDVHYIAEYTDVFYFNAVRSKIISLIDLRLDRVNVIETSPLPMDDDTDGREAVRIASVDWNYTTLNTGTADYMFMFAPENKRPWDEFIIRVADVFMCEDSTNAIRKQTETNQYEVTDQQISWSCVTDVPHSWTMLMITKAKIRTEEGVISAQIRVELRERHALFVVDLGENQYSIELTEASC